MKKKKEGKSHAVLREYVTIANRTCIILLPSNNFCYNCVVTIINQLNSTSMQYKLIYKVVNGMMFSPEREFDITAYIPNGWEVQSFSIIEVDKPSANYKEFLYHLAIMCVKELN